MGTTSGIGNRSPAFTLLEILIVIGLFSVVASLAIFNIDGLIRSFSGQTGQQVFQSSLTEARLLSLENKENTFLQFDNDAAVWIVKNLSGKLLYNSEAIELDRPTDAPILFRHSLVKLEEGSISDPYRENISHIAISSDGSMTPFAIRFPEESNDLVVYDPLSGYPMPSE